MHHENGQTLHIRAPPHPASFLESRLLNIYQHTTELRDREVVTFPRSPSWEGIELNSRPGTASLVPRFVHLSADSARGPSHTVGIKRLPPTPRHAHHPAPWDKWGTVALHQPSLLSPPCLLPPLPLSLLLGAQVCEGTARPCECLAWPATLSAPPAFVWPSARQLWDCLPGGGIRGCLTAWPSDYPALLDSLSPLRPRRPLPCW